MQGLDVVSNLSMSSKGQIITGTGIADEVGQNGGQNYPCIGKFGQSTSKDGLLCAIDELIGSADR